MELEASYNLKHAECHSTKAASQSSHAALTSAKREDDPTALSVKPCCFFPQG